ncbi:ATP-binding cassette domain-containing protein [Streptomyces sp. NPDC056374]|uniref:ATP-binding cassette domain-containing protein n=1 Tax=Streptomyces sp. NPDC056374 TaxID=3345799 RepID=UPI0035E25E6E
MREPTRSTHLTPLTERNPFPSPAGAPVAPSGRQRRHGQSSSRARARGSQLGGGAWAPHTEMHDRVEQALREAGLWGEVTDRLDTPAQTLSNGQRQQLCLARALALEPAALLLDVPTSALDEQSRDTVEVSMAALRGNRTVLLVSHDPAQVERLCDRTVRIDLANTCEPSPAAV